MVDIKSLLDLIKNGRNKKTLIAAAVAACLVVADVCCVFLPLLAKHSSLKARIAAVSGEMRDLNRRISEIEVTNKRFDALKAEFERYDKLFPKEERVPSLLGDISAIAGKLGVEIITIKPARQEAAGTDAARDALFREAPIEISAKGGFHQIGQFINRLETFDNFVEIRDIEITADRATPRRHFFRLLVSTYILKG
ncbi:MAG: type 4a pilus biogenesis protein PilO [Candidatus Omnitrophica bacterium]|nr:type 4a pilus biogenesis protein PilO [Candidatus Omnitrophota bacterium]